MLFLAGDSNYCRKQIDYYNDLTPAQEKYENVEFLKTLKGAWAWEIIECLFVYVLAAYYHFSINYFPDSFSLYNLQVHCYFSSKFE